MKKEDKNDYKIRATFYINKMAHRKLNQIAVMSEPKKSMSEIIEKLVEGFISEKTQNFKK